MDGTRPPLAALWLTLVAVALLVLAPQGAAEPHDDGEAATKADKGCPAPERASERAHEQSSAAHFQPPPPPPMEPEPQPPTPPAPPAEEPSEPSGPANDPVIEPATPPPTAPTAPAAPTSGAGTVTASASYEFQAAPGPAYVINAITAAADPQRSLATFTVTQQGSLAIADASASNVPGRWIAAYMWDWGDGTFDRTTEPRITHQYTDAWPAHRVTLVIMDDLGQRSATSRLVDWNPKEASYLDPVVDVTVRGMTVVVDATRSAADGVIVGYLWDWGDGTPPSTEPVATHVYAVAGTYAILIELTHENGARTFEIVEVDVRRPYGTADGTLYATETPSMYEVLFGTRGARLIAESPGPDLVPIAILGLALLGFLARRRA